LCFENFGPPTLPASLSIFTSVRLMLSEMQLAEGYRASNSGLKRWGLFIFYSKKSGIG
jgi:hypothetical protein